MIRARFLYRPWWLLLDGVRMVVRATVEARRNSVIWPFGMMVRSIGHYLVASPWVGLWLAVLVLVGADRPALVGGLVACVVAELIALAARWTGSPIVLGFWTFRRAVAVHRRWPRAWGDYAGRTRNVQAETGKEPSTPVRWRPLVDHPRLSWLFLPVGPGQVEFLVGPPPDRTFTDLVTACPALAAKWSFVESIEVEYESDRSSFGVLTVAYSGHGSADDGGRVLELVPDLDGGQGEVDTWLAE
jgi:hypothetical protein